MERTLKLDSGKEIIFKECSLDYIDQLEIFINTIAKESNFTLQREDSTFNKALAIKSWQRSLDSNHEVYLGAFDGKKLIGQIHFRVLDPEHPWIKHVGRFGMFVLKDYWGQGIGSELIQGMIEFVKPLGVKRIEATVRSKNKRALELYERLGFEVEGVRNKAAFIDGKFQDEYYISYLID